jgi:spermidine/putrescine transport system substrate-binding protein
MAITFSGGPRRSRPRIDPQLAEFVQAMSVRRIGRRDFLRSSAILGGGAFLAACGGISSESAQNTQESEGVSAATGAPSGAASASAAPGEKVLNFSNWPLYIDVSEDEQTHPTLDQFTEETGIEVNYYEDINSNEEYFGKIRNQLDAGESIGRDIIVLTDWMAARLIGLQWVQELDHSNIPNMSNLREAYQNVAFDEGRTYSLPWQSGLTGIGVNPSAVEKKITSINDLFDPSLAGRVTMLSEMRDTMGLIMAAMDIDPADHTFGEYQQAINRLKKAVDDGQIRQFTGNDYTTDLAAGNIAAAIAWSGDVIQLQFENPDLQFVVPDQGASLWSDNMEVPINAEHKANAEALMDFVYRPEIAAQIAAWVNYITPVDGAQEAMQDVDPELVEYELIFPSDELLSNTWQFKDLDEQEERRYQDAFQRVIGA